MFMRSVSEKDIRTTASQPGWGAGELVGALCSADPAAIPDRRYAVE